MEQKESLLTVLAQDAAGLAAIRYVLLSVRLQLLACRAEELKGEGLIRGKPIWKRVTQLRAGI